MDVSAPAGAGRVGMAADGGLGGPTAPNPPLRSV